MQGLLSLCLSVLLLFTGVPLSAGNVSKAVRGAVKELKLQGWKTLSGQETMEVQMERFMDSSAESDGDLPRYLVSTKCGSGSDYAAARKLALSLARSDIAQQIGSEITSLCSMMYGERQLSEEETEMVDAVRTSSIFKVRNNIGATEVAVELFRESGDGKVESCVYLLYDNNLIKKELLDNVPTGDSK